VIACSFHSSVSIARASNHHHVPYALGRLNRLALDGACFLALIGPSPLALIRRIRSILYARARRGANKPSVARSIRVTHGTRDDDARARRAIVSIVRDAPAL
tara:strand:+ start:66 stop:371 length:306 start_codon:yes stop_codon:yes gene_type:complete